MTEKRRANMAKARQVGNMKAKAQREARVKLAKKLRGEGKSLDEISDILGVSHVKNNQKVRYYLNEVDTSYNSVELRRERAILCCRLKYRLHMTNVEIAKQVGVSARSVQDYISEHGPDWLIADCMEVLGRSARMEGVR